MMGDNLQADGIRFVLDEEGYTDSTDRLILTRKFIAYLTTAKSISVSKLNKPMPGGTKKGGTMGKRGR
jgi:hypothetical protein